MDRSYTFVRGQVWYWDDPIFGRKDDNTALPMGDASIRFSRYVIVIQSTATISPNQSASVLVIPCSSGKKTQFDIQVPLHGDVITYTRTNSIFPAHSKCLQKYICTLSEVTMKNIEDQVLKLLVPSIGGEIECQGIDESPISEFVNITDINTPPEPHTLLDVNIDIPRKIGEVRWNADSISSFVRLYRKEGIQKASEKFKLKESSVYKYYLKWQNQVPLDEDTSINTGTNLKLKKYNEARLGISKLANIMKNIMEQESSLYNEVKSYLNYQTSRSRFYEGVRNSIYYSLLDFLGINKNSNNVPIQEINCNDPNINTWIMIHQAFYGKESSSIDDCTLKYMEYYGNANKGINTGWLIAFKHNLSVRVKMAEFALDVITDKVSELFCIKTSDVKIS